MSETEVIRVMIVDDHAVVRSGLSKFLMVAADLEMVGEAESGEQALARVNEYRPDVILMDLMMPGMGGVEAIRQVRQKFPNVQVVALTSFREEELVQAALQAGAMGYMLKNVSANELAEAIRSAKNGRMALSAEATQALVQASLHQAVAPGNELTEREKEVLALMVEGLSNNDIAERLYLSVGTVKFHVSNILQKLNASSRVEAVSIAIKQKLVK